MKKSNSSSYVLTLKLNTDASDEAFLHKRFYLSCKIHNRLVCHARKQLARMASDYRYRELMKLWHDTKNCKTADEKRRHSDISMRLKEIRLEYGLSEYQLHDYVKLQQHRHRHYLGSQSCQRIASAVWKSVEQYLFGKGKHVHYQKFADCGILYGAKTNATYMVYDKQNNSVRIGKYIIPASIDRDDLYACCALQDKIRYCQIVRKPFPNGYHYYVQLVMEGIPPMKHAVSDGRIGIDIGTSTIAVSAKKDVLFDRLGKDVPDYASEIKRIQRAMERSKRSTNPDRFNPDGTVKKGVRGRWVFSGSYKKLCMKKKSLERKQAAALRQSHETLANDIVAMGNEIYVEDMNFKTLQKRKAETTKSKNGRFHKKSRFGGSLKLHAPAMLLSIINRKLSYQGYKLHKVSTKTFRASQYNHVTDAYVKKKLHTRSDEIGGHRIQRDLYSAFLLMNSKPDLSGTDRNRCFETFNDFIRNHDRCMDTLVKQYRNGQHFPSCMGIRYFAA